MNHSLATRRKKRAIILGIFGVFAAMMFGLLVSLVGIFSCDALAAKKDQGPTRSLKKVFPHPINANVAIYERMKNGRRPLNHGRLKRPRFESRWTAF